MQEVDASQTEPAAGSRWGRPVCASALRELRAIAVPFSFRRWAWTPSTAHRLPATVLYNPREGARRSCDNDAFIL